MHDLHFQLMSAQRVLRQAAASEVVDLDWGRAYSSRRLSLMHDLNVVEIDDFIDAATVIAGTEEVASRFGWRHRKLAVASAEVASHLSPGLADAGYRQNSLATMRLTRPSPSDTPWSGQPGDAAIVSARAQEHLARAVLAEEPWAADELILECFAERDRWFEELGLLQFLIAPVIAPAARALLFDHGAIADIDSVTTLRSGRGCGCSRMVMSLAVSTAHARGTDEVMLVADPDDWPYQWYRRLGFVAVGRFAQFDRPVADS